MKSLRDYINLVEMGGGPGQTAAYTAQQQAAAQGQGATPAAKPRYKTPQEYDAEIARFSKTSNPALAPNKRYIDSLNAEKAALGKQQGATPAAPTAPTAAKAQPDPNVKALQDKLIAAGAKINADGIMGPMTRAAQAQFPNVTTQTDAEQAVAADYRSANDAGRDPNAGLAAAPAPAAAAAPDANNPWAPKQDTTKQDAWAKLSPEQQKWLGGADPTDPIIAARMRSAVPDAAPAAAPAAPVQEGVTYQSDELTRIVSLIQHR